MSATMRQEAPAAELSRAASEPQIRAGMAVRCRDGYVGQVAALMPSWAARPTHLVVRLGPLVRHKLALPLSWVAEVSAEQVVLRVRRRQLARVSPLPSDAQLAAAAREALHQAPPLREHDAFLAIDVTVHEQQATLRGNVRTIWRALLAETIVCQVRGVLEVRNELIADDELVGAVARALRQERRLEIAALQVEATLGAAVLRGQVGSPEQAALATLAARRVPGVRALISELTIDQPAASPPQPSGDPALCAARRARRGAPLAGRAPIGRYGGALRPQHEALR